MYGILLEDRPAQKNEACKGKIVKRGSLVEMLYVNESDRMVCKTRDGWFLNVGHDEIEPADDEGIPVGCPRCGFSLTEEIVNKVRYVHCGNCGFDLVMIVKKIFIV